MWVADQLIIDNWMAHHMAIEYQARVDLDVGTVPIVVEISNVSGGGYGGGANMQANLSWSNPSLDKEIVPQSVLMLPVWAGRPTPANGAENASQTSILSWSAGDKAASHDVYLGTDASALESKGNQESEIFDPGQLELATTYYWRVDEVNEATPDSPWTGEVWSFTTAALPVVDDMENYNDLLPEDYPDTANRIYDSWWDGFVDPANGSLVGNDFPPYAEQNIVHGGRQSMPFRYDNTTGIISEATKTLTYPKDWSADGANTLTIWFIGDVANEAEQMYVILNGSAIANHDNPDAAQIATWTPWDIPLQTFSDQGVDLTNVETVTIGFGNKGNPQAGGAGRVLFDDIALQAK
jgi:hypothetical protein